MVDGKLFTAVHVVRDGIVRFISVRRAMMAKTEHIVLEADPNDPEDFDVSDVALTQALAERRQRLAKLGRPRGSEKEQVTLRLDRDALARFKADGPGWQTRINEAVRKAAGL